MASVNFQKCKGGASAKAIIRHCDSEKRKKASHSNESIDTTKTDKNVTTTFTFTKKDGTTITKQLNYQETCARYDRRIQAIDEGGNKNKRKDRVTCFALCVPVPEGIKPEDIKNFYIGVSRILTEKYGIRNFVNSYIHFDEIHDYKDAETGQERTSRVHAHYFYIPERNGQLDGKWFSSRANMVDVNKKIDDFCREHFRIRFMDGTKKKSRKSVETLKNESKQQEYELAYQQGFSEAIRTTFKDFEEFFEEYGYSRDSEFRENYRNYFNEELPVGRSDPERETNNPEF